MIIYKDSSITLRSTRNDKYYKNPNLGNRGFWLSEEYQGKGYMTEVVAAVNDFIFFTLNIERFEASNAKNNPGSRRVKEKTGAVFLRYGDVHHHNGDTISEHWEVTRENWAKIRGREE